MPRYNVEHNGKWACFTSISDGFITEFMDKPEYEVWRKKKYGIHDYEPAEKRNMMTMKEVAFSIRLNRTHEEAMEALLECGLPESECERIMYDMETEYYVPRPKSDGKFKCPNCGRIVERDQRSCDGEDCCLDFVWRT
jgi:predicted RNA-binding Zn-ribbon protein involved in translation (DUF1610 family)